MGTMGLSIVTAPWHLPPYWTQTGGTLQCTRSWRIWSVFTLESRS